MSDDWQLAQGTVDFRNEERRAANRGPQDAPVKPVFDFGLGVEPQSDPNLCPVYDVVTHRLTGLQFVHRCTLPRGHRGACDV